MEPDRILFVDGEAIVHLYDALLAVAPSRGGVVARAVAVANATGPGPGLDEMDAADAADPGMEAFQPWWAARGDLLLRLGRTGDAASALQRAIDLAPPGAARRSLEARLRAASGAAEDPGTAVAASTPGLDSGGFRVPD